MSMTTDRPTVRRETGSGKLTRAKCATADCGLHHVRWFIGSRMRAVRMRLGLSLEAVARKMIQHGDGGAHDTLDPGRFDDRVLGLIEDGMVEASVHVVFAAAQIYGVDVWAFSECYDCSCRRNAPSVVSA